MTEHRAGNFARGARPGLVDLRGSRGGVGHVPPPSSGPIPPYYGEVVSLQNESTQTVEQQSQVVAGQNNPIRIPYGRVIIGADVAGLTTEVGALVLLCEWGEG